MFVLCQNRAGAPLDKEKLAFAHEGPFIQGLTEVIQAIKPTALLGVAAVPGAFTKEACVAMCANTERPIIFALSNPTSKAECTAEQVRCPLRLILVWTVPVCGSSK